jgi:predicted RNase H-like HicB family nuclease
MSERTKQRREAVEGVEYRYTAVFEPAEEGGYIVTVPALPGLVTEAETLEGARSAAHEAILGYLESLKKHNEEIPVEQGTAITEHVAVTLARS